ncbi:hypothetical protein ACFLSU_05465 [Bacteroidota bacterium]
MKNLVFILILMATLVSGCKNTDNQKVIKTNTEVSNKQVNKITSNNWIENIQLNHTEKWNANIETNEGVEKMQQSLKSQSTNTLEEYHELAKLLNIGKNYVIRNCSMKGESHDNLHVWLLPLIAKIDALSEAKTIENASAIKKSIQENIEIYYTYFK